MNGIVFFVVINAVMCALCIVLNKMLSAITDKILE